MRPATWTRSSLSDSATLENIVTCSYCNAWELFPLTVFGSISALPAETEVEDFQSCIRLFGGSLEYRCGDPERYIEIVDSLSSDTQPAMTLFQQSHVKFAQVNFTHMPNPASTHTIVLTMKVFDTILRHAVNEISEFPFYCQSLHNRDGWLKRTCRLLTTLIILFPSVEHTIRSLSEQYDSNTTPFLSPCLQRDLKPASPPQRPD